MSKKEHKQLPPQQSQTNESLVRKEGRQELAEEVVSFVAASFSGPLPPPETLEKYSRIIPNGEERIMVMAEEQSQHRRELEKTALITDSRNSLLGIIADYWDVVKWKKRLPRRFAPRNDKVVVLVLREDPRPGPRAKQSQAWPAMRAKHFWIPARRPG